MRVKGGVRLHRRHKKVLQRAKGYRHGRRRLFRTANQAGMKSGRYQYRDRRNRKRDMRRLWILRINAASRASGLSYSQLMYGLKIAGVQVDRKMLADLAVNDTRAFAKLVDVAREVTPA